MCVNFNCIFFRESMQLDLNKNNKKLLFISGVFSNRMVGAMGFEPMTFRSRTERDTKLRYAPN